MDFPRLQDGIAKGGFRLTAARAIRISTTPRASARHLVMRHAALRSRRDDVMMICASLSASSLAAAADAAGPTRLPRPLIPAHDTRGDVLARAGRQAVGEAVHR